MNKRTLALAVAWSLGSCVSLHAEPARAQSTDRGRQPDVEEVVVTAQRRSERLSEVPMSVTALTADQLKSQGVISPSDLERVVPGFTYQRSSYGVPVYSIRGVGFLDTALGVAPTVSIYVDQVPIAFSNMAAGAALDVERVEVLKGPQGTLYGQNSTGGAVNYIAAKPTDDLRAGFDVSYGRFSEVLAEGYLSGPLSETLGARLAVRTEQRGDWQENYTRDASLGERHFTTGRLLLDWAPNEANSVELGLTGWKDGSDTQAAQYFGYQPTANPPQIPEPGLILPTYPQAPRDARAADWNPDFDGQLENDTTFYQAYLRGEFEVWDDTALSIISTYSDYDADQIVDPDGVALSSLELHKFGTLTSFFNEARLSGAAGDRLSWMFGASMQRDEIVDNEDVLPPFVSSNTQPVPFLPRITSLRNNNTQDIDTEAVFASLDYNLTETLSLQGSVRYTKEDREFAGCSYDTNGSVVDLVNFLGSLVGVPQNLTQGGCYTFDPTNAERLPVYRIPLEEDNVSWRASIDWEPSRDTLLYFNVARGYKGGSFPTISALTVDLFEPATQEELLAYELGARRSFADRRVQFSGALFHYDYNDKQVLGIFQTIFGNLPKLTNIPESRVNGAEVQLTLAPADGLRLNLGATWVESEVTEHFNNLSNPLGQTVDIYGEAFPNSPEWQANADIQYEFSLSGTRQGYIGASASYRDSAQAGFGRVPQFVIPSYTLVDLRAGIKSDTGWRFEIWGRNVTDELYWNNIAKLTDTYSRTTGMPRTYGIRIAHDY